MTGFCGPVEVVVGLGPGSRGAEEPTGLVLEEPMNVTETGGAPFFFWGGVAAANGVCSTSFMVGLLVSDAWPLK